MARTRHVVITIGATASLAISIAMLGGQSVSGQQIPTMGSKTTPVNNPPNPYQTVEGYFKLPEARKWGSTSAVEVDKDGKSIWVAERCGANTCANSPTVNPILHFDETGKLLNSFGAGLMFFPHGIHVDRDGNVWVTDGNGNQPSPARAGGAGAAGRGAAAPGAAGAAAGAAAAGGAAAGAGRGAGRAAGATQAPTGPPKGMQVFKFSPDGKLLLTLGKAGGASGVDYFYQPNDVITSANGDIFVSDGHGNGSGRILKFDKTGKFIKFIGETGTGIGQLNIPHSLAFDSQGRLFVANRGNTAISIFDQEGKLLAEWYQFSRISGLYIDKNDVLYAADSESSPTSHPGGWQRGMRIGSAKDGKVNYFIPDPQHPDPTKAAEGGTTAAEGVVADAAGHVFGAEVGPMKVQRYVMR